MNLKTILASAALCTSTIDSLLKNESIAGSGSGSGEASIPLLMVDGFLSKREVNAPSITITTADNYKALKHLENILSKPINLGTGETLYLESVFMHNGYPGRVNDVNNGEFADYLYNYKRLTQAEVTRFANHTLTPGVKRLFEHAAENTGSVRAENRADVNCNEFYSTDNDDCEALQKHIGSKWWMWSLSGSWCSGSCCMSWSDNESHKVDLTRNRISQCQGSCSSEGKSCKIYEAELLGKTKSNFCLGAAAMCT